MRSLIFLTIPILITACAVDPEGYLKRSANNKLIDAQGFEAHKRRPLYNKKYINQAKRNILENNVASFDEEYDDDLSELEDNYRRNREMYLQMLDQDLARREQANRKNNSFFSKILPSKGPNQPSSDRAVLAKNVIKGELSPELDKTKANLLKEIAEIKLLLAEAKAAIKTINSQKQASEVNNIAMEHEKEKASSEKKPKDGKIVEIAPNQVERLQTKNTNQAIKENKVSLQEKGDNKLNTKDKKVNKSIKLASNKKGAIDAREKVALTKKKLAIKQNEKPKAKEVNTKQNLAATEINIENKLTPRVDKVPNMDLKSEAGVNSKEVLTTYKAGVEGFTEDELIIVRGQEYKSELKEQPSKLDAASSKISEEKEISNKPEKPIGSALKDNKDLKLSTKPKNDKTAQPTKIADGKTKGTKAQKVAVKGKDKPTNKKELSPQAKAKLKQEVKAKLAKAEKSIAKAKKLQTKAEIARAKKQKQLEEKLAKAKAEKLAKERAEKLAKDQQALENLPWLDEDIVTITPTNEIIISKKPKAQ
jgi:hypothetical protein